MNRRLQQFLDAENITQAQFAARVRATPASISHLLAGRNKPSFEIIQNIMKAYPELNIEWFINGTGKMYKAAAPKEHDTGSGLLFSDEMQQVYESMPGPDSMPREIEATSSEAYKSVQMQERPSNIKSSETSDTPSPAVKVIEKQRKAVKIVIFYDDGTFQEFQ